MIVPGIVITNGWWIGIGSEVQINQAPMGAVREASLVEVSVAPRADVVKTIDIGGTQGIEIDINPLFGAAFFFLAGALRLHPATATAGLVIGVGAAVINYGAGSAAAQEPVSFPSGRPNWTHSHLVL